MPTEDDPTIYVEYSGDNFFPPTNWENLHTGLLIGFEVKNGGLIKIPQCTINLKNTGGIYTGQGAFTIGLPKYIRVRANVRGTIDTLFFGFTYDRVRRNSGSREYLDVIARGITQALLHDYISKKYVTEYKEGTTERTLKQCIDHLLQYPDSGDDTGIRLITDEGVITTITAKHDFDRDTLLDAVNKIGEYAGYTGYEQLDGSQANIYMYPYGWQAASPAITIPNTVLERSYNDNIDHLFNHIIIWATVYAQYPFNDYCTEGGIGKGYWTPLNGECTLSDETNADNVKVNSKSIKVAKSAGLLTNIGGICTFPIGGAVNVTERKIKFLTFALKSSLGSEYVQVELEDYNGKKIWQTVTYKTEQRKYTDGFTFYVLELGSIYRLFNYSNWHIREVGETEQPKGTWYTTWAAGNGFNWNIKRIVIKTLHVPQDIAINWWIDGLYFSSGEKVNPLQDITLQSYDQTSINAYGRHVLYYDAPEIHYRDIIKEYADKILAATKDPQKKLTVRYGAKTWVKPNQYLTVNMPLYGINNEQWRVVEIEWDWKSATKRLRSTFTLTPRFQPLIGREWYRSQLEGLFQSMSW